MAPNGEEVSWNLKSVCIYVYVFQWYLPPTPTGLALHLSLVLVYGRVLPYHLPTILPTTFLVVYLHAHCIFTLSVDFICLFVCLCLGYAICMLAGKKGYCAIRARRRTYVTPASGSSCYITLTHFIWLCSIYFPRTVWVYHFVSTPFAYIF